MNIKTMTLKKKMNFKAEMKLKSNSEILMPKTLKKKKQIDFASDI